MKELLFEIGTEEIPAGYIAPALSFLSSACSKKLQQLGLDFDGMETFGTPRRLTLTIRKLAQQQPDMVQEHIGPSKQAGFDADGNPTKAAMGFARSKGLSPEALKVVDTAKGEYLMIVEEVKGQQCADLLPDVLEELIKELVFPKSMRWADTSFSFARPVQWIAALYGAEIIPVSIENISAGKITRGHRFMAPDSVEVTGIDQYLDALKERKVIADIATRREMVSTEVKQAVAERSGIAGAQPVLHEGLLDTVTNLVEHPFGVCGTFDEKFLELPDEALITSMREHQKYFPVVDEQGTLLPRFVAVNNTDIEDLELAASGHERVLRARLEDGLFFYNEDKKIKLSDRSDKLSGIIFQHKLGTMAEKTKRVMKIAGALADLLAPEQKGDILRAAELAKVDLLTEMVGEFPSLQGTMGREYALLDGEKDAVALAIEEHYLPVRAGGKLPESLMGAIVGLADRFDTIAGCFAIGERPTGNKDAFGLRRLTIAVLHLLKGLNISISLQEYIQIALDNYDGVVPVPAETAADILDFIRRRFENELIATGYAQDTVEAATAIPFDDPLECLARINALAAIRAQESFEVLAGSFKRIRNIIKDNQATEVNAGLLRDEAEKELFATLESVRQEVTPLLSQKEYDQALEKMLVMKAPVDQFFDQVMVMDEDLQVRQNRLNLLTALGEVVLKVGDISRMHKG